MLQTVEAAAWALLSGWCCSFCEDGKVGTGLGYCCVPLSVERGKHDREGQVRAGTANLANPARWLFRSLMIFESCLLC